MMGSFALGTLVTTLGINTKPIMTAEKELTTFAGKTNAIMSSVRRTMATVFATVSVGKLAKGFLDAAVSVENYKVSLNAVIKDARKTEAVFQDLFKWAAINPIDTDDAIKSFVRLKTAGIENTRAAVAAAADAAVVMHKPVEYVANAMVSTNNKMLRQIGVQLDRTGKTAIIRSGKVRIEVEKDIDKIRQGIIEVLQKNFGGAMDTFKNTWRGSLNTMKGLWWTFMTEVMGTSSSGGPYDTLVEGINRVKDAWIEWRNSADYSSFVEKTQAVFSAMIDGMISGITLLVKGFKWLIDNIELVKTAIVLFAGTKVMGAAIASMKFFRAEVALGTEATTFFMRFIYRLRLAFLELRTATTVVGGLKAAILALGLTPGGAVLVALGGLYVLAESLNRTFEQAYDAICKFNKELNKIPTEKINEVINLGHSMGGMGMGGNWAATIAKSVKDLNNQLIITGSWRDKMKDDYTGIHKPDIVLPDEIPMPKMGSSGGESKYKKLLQQMKDEAKYLGANVREFLPILDAWSDKMKPLSEDWKLIKDYSMEIRTGLAKDAGKDAADTMKRMEEQIALQQEAKEAAEQGVEQFWSKVASGFAQGMVKGEDYFNMLQTEFNALKESLATESGGFLNMDDMFNWSDVMLQRFAELQSVGEHLASIDLSHLTDQLNQGLLTKKEWVKQVEILIERYKELPLVVGMLSKSLDEVTNSSKTFTQEMSEAFEGWANGFSGQLNDMLWKSDVTFGEIAVSFAKMITQMLIQLLIVKPLMGWIMGFFGDGGVISNGSVTAYAKGGVVNGPTIFPMAHGMGLMGEDGPEAIMPLKRGADGKLGVAADSAGGGTSTPPVIINVLDKGDLEKVTYEAMAKYPGSQIVTNHVMRARSERSSLAFGGA